MIHLASLSNCRASWRGANNSSELIKMTPNASFQAFLSQNATASLLDATQETPQTAKYREIFSFGVNWLIYYLEMKERGLEQLA